MIVQNLPTALHLVEIRRDGGWVAPRISDLMVSRVEVSRGFRSHPFQSRTLCGKAEIVFILQIKPKLRRQPEIDSKAQRRVCRNGALLADNIADAGLRNVQILCQTISRQSERLHELGAQNLSGMD